MINKSLSEYLRILDLSEDYLDGGIRKPRADHPGFSGLRTAGKENGESRLLRMVGEIRKCSLCRLSEKRKNAVPGTGVFFPLVMIIGEGPGSGEDARGEPFVGTSGNYLDKWLEAIGLDRRKNVYITNLVKCRPPDNRDPFPDEIETCGRYLKRQIELVQPESILALGRIAAQELSGKSEGIGRLRGERYDYNGIPLFMTYHPSAVLRNPEFRKSVWEDLQRLRDELAAGRK